MKRMNKIKSVLFPTKNSWKIVALEYDFSYDGTNAKTVLADYVNHIQDFLEYSHKTDLPIRAQKVLEDWSSCIELRTFILYHEEIRVDVDIRLVNKVSDASLSTLS